MFKSVHKELCNDDDELILTMNLLPKSNVNIGIDENEILKHIVQVDIC